MLSIWLSINFSNAGNGSKRSRQLVGSFCWKKSQAASSSVSCISPETDEPVCFGKRRELKWALFEGDAPGSLSKKAHFEECACGILCARTNFDLCGDAEEFFLVLQMPMAQRNGVFFRECPEARKSEAKKGGRRASCPLSKRQPRDFESFCGDAGIFLGYFLGV